MRDSSFELSCASFIKARYSAIISHLLPSTSCYRQPVLFVCNMSAFPKGKLVPLNPESSSGQLSLYPSLTTLFIRSDQERRHRVRTGTTTLTFNLHLHQQLLPLYRLQKHDLIWMFLEVRCSNRPQLSGNHWRSEREKLNLGMMTLTTIRWTGPRTSGRKLEKRERCRIYLCRT